MVRELAAVNSRSRQKVSPPGPCQRVLTSIPKPQGSVAWKSRWEDAFGCHLELTFSIFQLL